MKVTWRKSTTGEDEVKLVLIKHGLLDVDEGANFRCPIRQEVAVRNGERALEHPLRFRQMCSQKFLSAKIFTTFRSPNLMLILLSAAIVLTAFDQVFDQLSR